MNARTGLGPTSLDALALLQCRGTPPAVALRRLDAAFDDALRDATGVGFKPPESGPAQGPQEAPPAAGRAGSAPGVPGDTASGTDAVPPHPPRDDATGTTPWRALCSRLALSREEAEVLLAVLAPELAPRYGALGACLHDDATLRAATPELVARLAGPDPAARRRRRLAASPAGRLQALGLIEWAPGTEHVATQARRSLRVPPPLADWLCGLPYADERLAAVPPWQCPACQGPVALAEQDASRAQRLADALRAGDPCPVVGLAAADGAEALAYAREILRLAGRPALVLDAALLSDPVAAGPALHGARLAHVVSGVGIVLQPPHDAPDVLVGALRALACVADPLLVVERGGSGLATRIATLAGRPVLALASSPLSAAGRADAWQAGAARGAPAVDAALLADRYVLGPARIAAAIVQAGVQAAFDGAPLDTRRLLDAARAQCGGDGAAAGGAAAGAGVTRRIESPHDWPDLVLPNAVQERLDDIVHAIASRGRVLERWGYGRSLGVQPGLKAMFAGASGTGKSMAAGLVAKTLALDLHRIELAAVVSKYIGETEKNLDRAFDAASAAQAVLFIDEADALLGKRAETKSAHDRYANVETAYLLQKMEDHGGVVILATNLANNIDAAFSRRMHFVVEFPLPDAACRERLWRRMIPAGAPRADDIDFGFLARQFELAGGDIRNVVLDAAYAAARAEASLGMAHLLRAVARQYAKRGRVAGAAEFRGYLGLLEGDPAGTRAHAVATAGTGGAAG